MQETNADILNVITTIDLGKLPNVMAAAECRLRMVLRATQIKSNVADNVKTIDGL